MVTERLRQITGYLIYLDNREVGRYVMSLRINEKDKENVLTMLNEITEEQIEQLEDAINFIEEKLKIETKYIVIKLYTDIQIEPNLLNRSEFFEDITLNHKINHTIYIKVEFKNKSKIKTDLYIYYEDFEDLKQQITEIINKKYKISEVIQWRT